MEHHHRNGPDESGDVDLDPRIQIELEKLNNATDEINKLEIELDEANTTFRLLLNESTRRLKLLSKKLGSCIERARPYYEALEVARQAQYECQRAAVQFQRANEIHQAAKETVALAEQRFLSKQHEWQFDNAWQEMLNHATIKVMDAETQKAESGREHQKRATLFNAAEQEVQRLEQKLRRSISKSRPYFEEKAVCQGQLAAQKERVEALQNSVSKVKRAYANSLKELERISEEIHCKRGVIKETVPTADDCELPVGPREPGVGAELNVSVVQEFGIGVDSEGVIAKPLTADSEELSLGRKVVLERVSELPDYELELDRCDMRSIGSLSVGTSSAVSEKDDSETADDDDNAEELEELKLRFRELAIRPVEGREEQGGSSNKHWELELNATVAKLDHMLHMQECVRELKQNSSSTQD